MIETLRPTGSGAKRSLVLSAERRLVLAVDGDAVDDALANAVKKSVAQIDGSSASELKTGLAEAQAGMAG